MGCTTLDSWCIHTFLMGRGLLANFKLSQLKKRLGSSHFTHYIAYVTCTKPQNHLLHQMRKSHHLECKPSLLPYNSARHLCDVRQSVGELMRRPIDHGYVCPQVCEAGLASCFSASGCTFNYNMMFGFHIYMYICSIQLIPTHTIVLDQSESRCYRNPIFLDRARKCFTLLERR